MILRSLLIVANPYIYVHMCMCVNVCVRVSEVYGTWCGQVAVASMMSTGICLFMCVCVCVCVCVCACVCMRVYVSEVYSTWCNQIAVANVDS